MHFYVIVCNDFALFTKGRKIEGKILHIFNNKVHNKPIERSSLFM